MPPATKKAAPRRLQTDDKPRKAGFCKGMLAPGLCGASELRLPLAAECCQSAFVNTLKPPQGGFISKMLWRVLLHRAIPVLYTLEQVIHLTGEVLLQHR